jgi:sec-independent protein translocase protein TatC
LFYVALSVVFFGGVGYSIQQDLVSVLLKPAAGQQFIYTSPGGGINFLFQICIYFGVVLSIPIIMAQLFKYMEPLIPKHSRKFIIKASVFSVFLAVAGLCFGYFIGLPGALHFLANQFSTDSIKPLFTIQEYMSFVSIYLVGSAVLFQIPLILLFINRITPLKPMKLLKIERFVVLGAFVIAAFITPTPDIFNQCIIAGPIIGVYQLGIILVWLHNRRHPAERKLLLKRDAELRAERLAKRAEAELLGSAPLPAAPSIPAVIIQPANIPFTKVSASTEQAKAQPQPSGNHYRRNRPVVRSTPQYKSRPNPQRWTDFGDIRPARSFTQARQPF